jgi:hypothetical protein
MRFAIRRSIEHRITFKAQIHRTVHGHCSGPLEGVRASHAGFSKKLENQINVFALRRCGLGAGITVDPFKNFILNLKAPGREPLTVLIGWMFGVVALGIFGHGEIASYALGLMGIVGGVILTTLAVRT